MPRPKSKDELVELSKTNFNKLLTFVSSLSNEEANKEFPKGTLNRNVSDILTHLHHWHLMMLDWYKVGMEGGKPDMPAKGYTWKTLPELNKVIWNKYQNTELIDAIEMMSDSYTKIQELIHNHTDKELFEKKRYNWTGSTSLGDYLISNTSSHYDWAIKQLKRNINLSSN